MTTKNTKGQYSVPNGRKIFQMAINYANLFLSNALQNVSKFWNFGLQINHLATLVSAINA
jgi:hypothetical protein